ncbi:MAG: helix-turn-helix domain-containing protein, partial [Acidobacteriota bacterium]|nr:helix-turn-helix domain-containing protein [Acidobacteriota bacterium]
MATYTTDQLLTVADVAERLEMTNDGVYKLIQRGKLDAVRLSARKTRVSAQSLERYMQATQAWVDRYLDAQPRIDVQTL